jgi:hypothetical protein
MSPFVLIALAALLGFIVGWFAHGPKEPSAPMAAVPGPAAPVAQNPLVAEVDRLKQLVTKLETANTGLEAMVHGRDATLTDIARKAAETAS